jgi:hypothetical protein
MGSRGIYHEGWMASTFGPRTPWVAELSGLTNGIPVQDDLAAVRYAQRLTR